MGATFSPHVSMPYTVGLVAGRTHHHFPSNPLALDSHTQPLVVLALAVRPHCRNHDHSCALNSR